MLLRALGVCDDRAQSLTVAKRRGEGDANAHAARLACHGAIWNPKSDSFDPINPLAENWLYREVGGAKGTGVE
jgi:hypothetical protein